MGVERSKGGTERIIGNNKNKRKALAGAKLLCLYFD